MTGILIKTFYLNIKVLTIFWRTDSIPNVEVIHQVSQFQINISIYILQDLCLFVSFVLLSLTSTEF